jgi:hypothetical protein
MTGTRTLELYELAYLTGGPRRAVETAVIALVEAGVLRVNQWTGELMLIERRPCSELEAAVLDVVGFRGFSLLGTVCWRMRADARLTAIEQRLQADGLLSHGDGLESLRRRWWTVFAVTGAGRRILRRRRRELSADETDAVRVALSGPEAMRDRGLYVALFNPSRAVPALQLRLGTADSPSAGGYAGYSGADPAFLAGGAFAGGLGGADCGGGGGDGGGGGC